MSMVERFESITLSRKRVHHILQNFKKSSQQLGDDRNAIRIVEDKGKKLVVKSFKIPNAVNKLAYRFLRDSKAKRSYENAVYLQQHNIGTPAPLAYLERVDTLSFKDSYYISEYAEHDYTYRELINDNTIENKEEVLKAFTAFMFKMHEAHIYFLDHSPGNTLIKKVGDSYEFFLVDLNRMKFYDIPYEDRLKNFERLSPKKWMYDIMGAEYARLSGKDPAESIATMWSYTQKFQEKYHRKKRFKKKLKSIFS
ncbi:lipopolysaccharide kinase InaA family protein [Nonlabens ponticola]|uniref:Kdo domain containing protein n=1 Tax=Nonlabens ponticola TaxID=2496866 RepID=A0A3S9MX90_9FLAO|nr:lipopolysaccharide kinase InaA family protein [Nonlabens ponticola]AZQ43754.1 Kdo domain containing protein [Nonlabens ponticola]